MSQPISSENGSHPGGGPPAATILVAEADADLLLDIEEALRAEGHEVIMTRTGEDALRLAGAHLPFLVILDASLPGLSGYEVSRRLRSDWRFLDRGIIILEGEPSSMDRSVALAAGADDVVPKPVPPIALADRVQLTFRRLQERQFSSPLTGLPGNVAIERELRRRTNRGMDVGLAHIDIDNFKAFNDRYGFLRGDEMIRTLAAVMRDVVDASDDAFLGHVGGDDFVLLARCDQVEEIGREIVSAFEAMAAALLDPEDAVRGWIEVRDRRGKRRRYPLPTLSIGVAVRSGPGPTDHSGLVHAATELKRYAKTKRGNHIAVDRRASEDPPPVLEVSHRPAARRPRVVPLKAMRAIAAALLLLGGVVAGPAVVVASENAMPGEFLWPVKLRIEAARLALESDPSDEARLHLEFASRRVSELEQMVAMGGDRSAMSSVISSLEAHTESTAHIVGWMARPEAPISGLLVQAEGILSQNVGVLETLVATACGESNEPPAPPEAACPGLRQALGSSREVLETVGGTEEEGTDGRPPGDLGEPEGPDQSAQTGDEKERADPGGLVPPDEPRGTPPPSRQQEGPSPGGDPPEAPGQPTPPSAEEDPPNGENDEEEEPPPGLGDGLYEMPDPPHGPPAASSA
jgi:diguanylate cyclase (GGDEF)-like protein